MFDFLQKFWWSSLNLSKNLPFFVKKLLHTCFFHQSLIFIISAIFELFQQTILHVIFKLFLCSTKLMFVSNLFNHNCSTANFVYSSFFKFTTSCNRFILLSHSSMALLVLYIKNILKINLNSNKMFITNSFYF